MSIHQPSDHTTETPDGREPYHKPEMLKIELALTETLSTGCKLTEASCTGGEDEFGVPGPTLFLDLGS